jgi:hypothetical protein
MNTGLFLRSCRLAAAVALTATFAVTLPVHVQAQKTKRYAYQPADGDPLVDSVADGRGRINFNQGVVKATGYGAPPPANRTSSGAQSRLMALGAARADALRTLAMAVSSIQVTAETTVKNYVLEKDEVRTSLSALLQSPRIVSEKMMADGTAEVVVELPMYGPNSVASVVLPEVLPAPNPAAPPASVNIPPIAPAITPGTNPALIYGAGADKNGNFKGPKSPAVRMRPPVPTVRNIPNVDLRTTPLSDNGPFTAVIIDCRGLNVEAIMSPKLYDTTGREVYGTMKVSYDFAIDTGIVGYPRSAGEAVISARAGKRPLVVRALRVADKHRFHPVISLEDGDRILAANQRDRFLEQCRVIFLVDPVR